MTDRAPATLLIFIAIVIGFGVEIATGAWQDPYALGKLGAIIPSLVIKEGEYRGLSQRLAPREPLLESDGPHASQASQLGRLYEMMFGTRRFLLIYFVTGIAASLATLLRFLLMQTDGASVGASGAIFGIIGALIISIRRSRRWKNERWARGVVQQLMFWIVVNIVIGFTVPQIDMAAHVGGFLTGLLLGATLPQREPPMPPSQAVIDVTPSG